MIEAINISQTALLWILTGLSFACACQIAYASMKVGMFGEMVLASFGFVASFFACMVGLWAAMNAVAFTGEIIAYYGGWNV